MKRKHDRNSIGHEPKLVNDEEQQRGTPMMASVTFQKIDSQCAISRESMKFLPDQISEDCRIRFHDMNRHFRKNILADATELQSLELTASSTHIK